MHVMSIEESLRDLVVINESTDPAMIELDEVEVENSSYQFEVGEKFA